LILRKIEPCKKVRLQAICFIRISVQYGTEKDNSFNSKLDFLFKAKLNEEEIQGLIQEKKAQSPSFYQLL